MKPILFNTDMVRAILKGRKMVTRRVVKGYALDHLELDTDSSIIGVYNQDEGCVFPIMDYAPYRPSDILYVRETWQHGFGGTYLYKASAGFDWFMTPEGKLVPDIPWKPSIHMPREAARIFLRVTEVRVERLQDITPGQLRAEGLDLLITPSECKSMMNRFGAVFDYERKKKDFSNLWDSTIKKADHALYGWDADPWVWVIEFERISREEAQQCL